MSTDGARRRSSAEVQELIASAARELFASQGYEETSTREIARKAGVIQAAVFRHFGTKEALFEHVALQPLYEFVDGFVERRGEAGAPDATSEEVTRAYVHGLLRLVQANGVLFSMLANAETGNRFRRSEHAARAVLARHLADLERSSAAQAEALGQPVMNMAVAVRFTIALVLGTALFQDTLFPADEASPSNDRLADELADYVLRAAVLPPPE